MPPSSPSSPSTVRAGPGDPPAPLELFRAALAGENRHGRPPVWLMRQAGRYMPEYRAIRERHSFREMCADPDLAYEVSLLPDRLLDVDAIIVFNDILIPLAAMGAGLEFGDDGPVFAAPVRDESALAALRTIDPERDTPSILETLRRLSARFAGRKPVLGFAGAPFTLAAYLIEGRVGSRGVETLMRVLRERPAFLRALLDKLADMTAAYLDAQIDAGATAVQLFDTWAGRLDARDYREFALPYAQRIFAALASRRPAAGTILFVRDGAHLVADMAAAGATGISLDWRAPLGAARAIVGPRVALQGNLDPTLLFAPPAAVRERTIEILEDRRRDPAFIFNLGHGVLPETPVESVRMLVDTVRGWPATARSTEA